VNRFPVFDHDRKPEVEVIDGLPTILNQRDVLQEFEALEPLDERVDFFATVPMRSCITPNAGPSFELGPFCLDTTEVIKLYNALAKHANSFPDDFQKKKASA
jgi:hypothetical protein